MNIPKHIMDFLKEKGVETDLAHYKFSDQSVSFSLRDHKNKSIGKLFEAANVFYIGSIIPLDAESKSRIDVVVQADRLTTDSIQQLKSLTAMLEDFITIRDRINFAFKSDYSKKEGE